MSEWKLLSQKRINPEQWDACIARQNGEVFSEAWYWNAVCKSWKGWVLGNYEAVIPWPVQHKFAVIPTLKTPLYVKWIEGEESHIRESLSRFRGIKKLHVLFEGNRSTEKQVQILQLSPQWEPSQELAKNLRKAEKNQPEWVQHVVWADFQKCMQRFHPYPWPNIQQQTMQRLYEAASALGRGAICGVRINNEWAAMQFYIHHRGRLYLIQNVVNPQLRSHEPMPWLLYQLFLHCRSIESETRVNFMGSSNPGVARFNEKFGAMNKSYLEL
ncbi:MAG: GNAT family N-acetyltransferase [Flavobacteriales bacterium]|jgi:hypothetical protein